MTDFFFTDWEGPWVTTDFAYEIATRVLKNQAFFERISQYDDYLSYIVKKNDYEPGDTLKLLAPFLIASGMTSNSIKEISSDLASFVPHARAALNSLTWKPVVISTSYRQFLEITAGMLDIKEKIHGTELRIEEYDVTEEDKEIVNSAIHTIASLPPINVHPQMARDELDDGSRESVDWLNTFFWEELSNTSFEPVLEDVKAVGGKRKKQIVQKYMDELNFREGIAVGDSISDYAMLDFVRENGVAVSFNGNDYAIKHSNVAVVSDTAFGEAAIVDAYSKRGIDGVIDVVKNKNHDFINPHIASNLSTTEFYWLEDAPINTVSERSKYMRKRLRGGAGDLG